MSADRQTVSIRDLVDEAKKRIVFVVVCVVGLSYLLSLTSSSVVVNFPAAAFLIIILRYLSLDVDKRKKSLTYDVKSKSTSNNSPSKTFDNFKASQRSDWKHKVNSPVVEDAISQFSEHIVSEWVTDLWYCRITPDKQGPEAIVLIINGVFAEFSSRVRNINPIDILTREIISILCSRLENFRASKTKIEKLQSKILTIEERDMQLKSVLAAEKKLHPALFSAKAEHKVLQHVMDGLISLTFQPEDLQCSLFRYMVRELLACAVIRPVINLINPRFINERIESLITRASKTDKRSVSTNTKSQSRINGSAEISTDHVSPCPDPSAKGVELVSLKKDTKSKKSENFQPDVMNGEQFSKDPLLSMDTQSTRSWSSLPETNNGEGRVIQRHNSGGEWGDMLDPFSRRKTETLAPEHLDNMWTKGRGYNEGDAINQIEQLDRNSQVGILSSMEHSGVLSEKKKNECGTSSGSFEKNDSSAAKNKVPGANGTSFYSEEIRQGGEFSDGVESCSSSSSSLIEEDDYCITGLDSPGNKVWDGKTKRNSSRIHHPLETLDGRKSRKASKAHLHSERLHRTKSAKKRSRSSTHNGFDVQKVEKPGKLLGERQDIKNSSTINDKSEGLSKDTEFEQASQIIGGSATSSSISLAALPESHCSTAQSAKNSIISDSFFRLRCEVVGANIVESGSKTFAVYSISVTDVNSSWSIKRRFRHFEELHRRLKDFDEYNLHLPPKHFLSTSLEVSVILERCKILNQYLKKLLLLPVVSCSFEVGDFLSIDSQMYIFSDLLSIVESLSGSQNSKEIRPAHETFGSRRDNSNDIPRPKINNQSRFSSRTPEIEKRVSNSLEHSTNISETLEQNNKGSVLKLGRTSNQDQVSSSVETNDTGPDHSFPIEWIPPNLSAPILDLVDTILQLKDGGWIRRKAFWVAKQVLQLGMGDAFDDWLLEKIQLLRHGAVVASGINRLEQILWPDGIFITKHPKRQKPPPSSPSHNSNGGQPSTPRSENAENLEDTQEKEAERRAKLVYETMIDNAPAVIVSLVGRKEYELCAKDLYYFIQSSIYMKLLAFDLLQLLLLSAFPELEQVFGQLDEDKDNFGELDPSYLGK